MDAAWANPTWASALTPSIAPSARLRSATARSSEISARVVSCLLSQPFWSHSSSVIEAADDGQPGSAGHRLHQVTLFPPFPPVFRGQIHHCVDLPPKLQLRRLQGIQDLGEL